MTDPVDPFGLAEIADLKAKLAEVERERDAWRAGYGRLETQLAAEREQIRRLSDVLRTILASAHPNADEHPTMYAVWQEARAALEPQR
jgi:septal ring factor EnvC (AmiA/AmiB activator)